MSIIPEGKIQSAELDRAKFYFNQPANCLSDSDHWEELEIECTADLGIDGYGGFFMVLKTKKWSIDSIDDLQILIDRIKRIIDGKKNENSGN